MTIEYTDVPEVTLTENVGVTEVKTWGTEADWHAALDHPGIVSDELADHAGGEAGVAHSGYDIGSLTRGLVAYYPLDEGSGSTAVDATELSNDGTINGATYAGSGQVGADSLSFDGTDDVVTVPDSESLRAAGKDVITFSVWFFTDSIGTQVVIDKDEEYTIFYDRAGNQDLNFGSYGDNIYFGTPGLATGSWHHFVLIWRVGSSVSAWVNSTRHLDEATYTNTPGDGEGTTFDLTLAVSNDSSGTGIGNDFFFDGQIDDVRIYDRALSPIEIEALAARTETSPVTAGDTLQ